MDCQPEEKENRCSSKIQRLKEMLNSAFYHSVEELIIIKKAQEETETPIEQHFESLYQLFQCLTSKQTYNKDILSPFIEKIVSLQKEEPKFAYPSAEILHLLSQEPLDIPPILEKIIQLKENLRLKMRKLISKYNSLSENSEQLLFNTISNKFIFRKKCQNPYCPLEQKQAKLPASRQMLVSLKKCSRCQVALYCSKDCQRQDWGRHKADCSGLISTLL